MLLNAYVLAVDVQAEARLEAQRRRALELGDGDAYEAARTALDALSGRGRPVEPQPCAGVRGGSTQPCTRWRTDRVDRRMRYGW